MRKSHVLHVVGVIDSRYTLQMFNINILFYYRTEFILYSTLLCTILKSSTTVYVLRIVSLCNKIVYTNAHTGYPNNVCKYRPSETEGIHSQGPGLIKTPGRIGSVG